MPWDKREKQATSDVKKENAIYFFTSAREDLLQVINVFMVLSFVSSRRRNYRDRDN